MTTVRGEDDDDDTRKGILRQTGTRNVNPYVRYDGAARIKMMCLLDQPHTSSASDVNIHK